MSLFHHSFQSTSIEKPAARFFRLRFGLVPQVVALVVATVVVVGGLISTVMVRQNQNTLSQQIVANNLAAVDLAAEFINGYMEATQLTVDLLAKRPSVEHAALSGNFVLAAPELRNFLQLNNRVDNCSTTDAQGVIRATGNVSANRVGASSGDREWFQRAMASGAPYLGVPIISRGTGLPTVPYAVPILGPSREVKGIVICGISLATLNEAIAKYRTGPSARAALIDLRRNGIILAHPDRKRILTPVSGRNQAVNDLVRGARGARETQDSSGGINLAVYAPVPHLPWGVLILQPRDVVFAPVAKAARQSLYFVALLLVLAALASGWLARRATRPLLRLRAATRRLADGDLTARVNFTRQDEVGDLGRAFDQMATALAEHSAQLRAANDELQSQYLQLQEANRLKSEFLANMSHELRTPLNAIIGFAQLIHDGKVGPTSADQREYLNDILTSADHLLQLINDVLDLARVESGKLELKPEPVALKKLIAEVRNILQPLAAGKHLAIDFSVDDAIDRLIIDSAKLKQVLYNYLSNAIKFTDNGGRIIVRARPEDERYFRLEVEDNGIGIMPDEIGKLFMAFQQLDSGAAKKHQGTGLGLALSKKIVEAQGGRVGVESARGRGSVFYAILPIDAGAKAEPAAETLPATLAEDAPTVLIIEDNEADRKWLGQILTDAGYRVDTARNGVEALAKARSDAYAAILLDLILPDTTGWDTLHAIRAAGPNRNAPVIVVTVVAERGIAKGFPIQDYLVKPVRPNILLDSLRSAGLMTRSPRRRILVLDDDVTTLKLASVGLQAGGYEVVCHSSGVRALRDAELIEFAAVVLDLLMPQMDGFEFLDRLRRIDSCRNVPVIIWTSKDVTAGDLARLKNAAQTVALKNRDGIDAVLKELQRYAPSADGAAEPVEAVAAAQ